MVPQKINSLEIMFPLQYRPSTGVWVSNIFLGPDEIILWQLLLYALSHTTFFASSNLASQRSQEICGTCQRLTSSPSALSGSSGPKSGNLSGCEVSSLLIGGVAVSTVIDRDGVNSQFFSELMTLGFLADIRSSKKIRQIPWIVSTTQFWSGWFMNVSPRYNSRFPWVDMDWFHIASARWNVLHTRTCHVRLETSTVLQHSACKACNKSTKSNHRMGLSRWI